MEIPRLITAIFWRIVLTCEPTMGMVLPKRTADVLVTRPAVLTTQDLMGGQPHGCSSAYRSRSGVSIGWNNPAALSGLIARPWRWSARWSGCASLANSEIGV